MTHDEILREHAARYAQMTPEERVEQEDSFLKLPRKHSDARISVWNWVYFAGTSVVFGYWKNSFAAGIFLFLVLAFFRVAVEWIVQSIVRGVTRIETRMETVQSLLEQRLEDPTGGCTGYRDCLCWWHTEQRRLAAKQTDQ